MYDYVTKELPSLVAGLFPVDPVKMSVTGTHFWRKSRPANSLKREKYRVTSNVE